MHLPWSQLDHLSPGESFRNRQPFDDWFRRIEAELPHVPRCVAEQWLHRHWGESPFWWLRLGLLRFEKQSWTIEEVLSVREGEMARWDRGSWLPELARPGNDVMATWLGKYMLANQTWPVPIIVLDNVDKVISPYREELARKHLLEGHTRHMIFHHLAHVRMALPKHEVWVARLVTA